MANVISRVSPRTGPLTVLVSAARTATPDTQQFEILGHDARALHVIIDATAVTATPALTVTISGVDPLSGQVYTLLASTAIATVSTTVLKVGPGLTAAANAAANDYLPRVFRITATHGDADSITYSIGAHLCP